jgi:diguanylate cyclase (GGDEF)-like protein
VTHWVDSKNELTRINLELSHLARHDNLTGLFNKPMFLDTLELANSRLERLDGLLGVLYIDLDGFKPVNDRYGHDIGDRVLVEVGSRLRGAVRTSDVMARLGGDEFGAILENLKAPRDALKVADLLIEVLAKPFIVDGKRIAISASVGAVVANRRVADSTRLLVQADRMMYRAKRLGRARSALEYLGETEALHDAVQ